MGLDFFNSLILSPGHNDNCTLTFQGNLLCSVGKVRIREMSILMLSTGTMTTFLVNGFKIDAKLLKRFYLKCRLITTTFSAPPRVCLLASSLMSGYDKSFLPLGPDAEVVVSTLAARLLKCNFKRYSLVV